MEKPIMLIRMNITENGAALSSTFFVSHCQIECRWMTHGSWRETYRTDVNNPVIFEMKKKIYDRFVANVTFLYWKNPHDWSVQRAKLIVNMLLLYLSLQCRTSSDAENQANDGWTLLCDYPGRSDPLDRHLQFVALGRACWIKSGEKAESTRCAKSFSARSIIEQRQLCDERVQ